MESVEQNGRVVSWHVGDEIYAEKRKERKEGEDDESRLNGKGLPKVSKQVQLTSSTEMDKSQEPGKPTGSPENHQRNAGP
jgi:hypothetical protein